MMKLYGRLRPIVSLLLMLTSTALLAQQANVSGSIIDENGAPIPGVTILEKGTSNGTNSDNDGKYTLNVSGSSATLVISFIGYKSQEIAVNNQTAINVSLVPDITALQEVVVTGYSVDQRRDITGAVSTVKARALSISPSGNVEQQLQGRVPGVTVITNGQPGTTSQIRVRGFGAFGGNEPLYIVDGLPVTDTNFLNPDDIESTTVLKDASTASIYGARAANGVIVYTTKKGTRGSKKLSITVDSMFGVTNPGTGQKMMNPQDFADWTWNATKNTAMQLGVPSDSIKFTHPQFGTGTTPLVPDYLLVGTSSGVTGSVDLAAEKAKYNVTDFSRPIYQVVKANKSGTDWYKAITHNAPLFRNTIGIRGGGENSRFYFGLSSQEQDGILNTQHFSREAFRVNTEFNILKNLRIGENLQFTYRATHSLQGGNGGQGISGEESIVLTAFRMPSIIPIYDEFGGYAGTRAPGFNNPANPVASLDGGKDSRGFENRSTGNLYLEFEPIKGLTARTSYGGNFGSSYFWSYQRRTYENSENNSAVSYSEGAAQAYAWTFTNTLDYKKSFSNLHNFDLLVGQEALNTGKGRNMSGTGLNPFSEDRDFVTLNTTAPGATRTVGSNYFKGVNFSSYFGRLNYSFNDRYIASVVVRRDGSSRFGANNRYGVFPAFSAAWRISSEPFMNGLKSVVDDLKIRGGYGIMGNSNNVDPNNQYSLYQTNVGNSSYPIAGTGASEGYYRSRIGNPNARWEKAVTTNIGFDGTFLSGKMDIIVDFWNKDTRDLLFSVPQTSENGLFAAVPSVNVGKMMNRGVDIQVITRGKISGKIGYEFTVNGGFLKNQIVALSPGIIYLPGDPGFRGINPIRNQLGRPISSFFGYQVLGLFQNQADIDAAPTQSGVIKTADALPGQVPGGVGRFKFADLDGDGKITQADRTWLGSPVPKFTGGMNFKFTFVGFELESYMFLSLGGKIWNQSKWFTDFYPSFAGAAISERVKQSWTPTNTGATIPIFENVSNFSTQSANGNSFYVENGSYFRMQNITLSYNLPSDIARKISMERLRVFISTNNVFTISKYQGMDPSVGGNADLNFGIDVGNYPITRSYTCGLSFGF